MTQVVADTDAYDRDAVDDAWSVTGAEYFGCFACEEFVGHGFAFDVLECKTRC